MDIAGVLLWKGNRALFRLQRYRQHTGTICVNEGSYGSYLYVVKREKLVNFAIGRELLVPR